MKFFLSSKFQPVYWVGFAVLILAANFNTDPFVDFPMLFIIPVAIASWYGGRWWGLSFAFTMPLVRLVFTVVVWDVPWTTTHSIVNASIRIIVLSSFAILLDLLHHKNRRITVLEGLLPLCYNCKRIRNEANEYQPLDVYLNQHAGTVFLQGLCADCLHQLSSQIAENKG